MQKDQVLWFPVLALLSFGLLFVYSASSVYAAQKFNDEFMFVKKQILYLIPAFLAAILGTKISIPWLLKRSNIIFYASVLLVVATRIPGLGRRVNGAARWIAMGPIQFQPSELLKFASLILMTKIFANRPRSLVEFWPLMVSFVALLIQPDFGSCLIIALCLFTMLFLYGLPLFTFASLIALTLPVLAAVAIAAPYRLKRLVTFLDPYADAQGAGFQVIQSFVGIASGGWFGRGLGGSQQKLFFLPEAHTDFILAVIAEEMGFLGIATIAVILGLFFFACIQVIKSAAISSEKLLATGIFASYFGSTFINMGMTAGVFPTKGLPLPFVSSGGSALVANFFLMGIMSQIAKRSVSKNVDPANPIQLRDLKHVS